MIHAFSVKNYKSLVSTEDVELKPLTLLSGINNAGKTTFIQAILDLVNYDLRDTNHTSVNPKLSRYKTKVFNNELENLITFKLKVDLSDNDCIEITSVFKYDEGLKRGFLSKSIITRNKGNKKSILELTKEKHKDSFKIYSDKGLGLLFFKLKENTEPPLVFEGYGDFHFVGYIPMQGKIFFKENEKLSNWFEETEDRDHIQVGVNDSAPLIDTIFEEVKYIGPLRTYPKDVYTLELNEPEINSFGEHTIEVLHFKSEKKIEYFKKVEDTKPVEETLEQAIGYWIDYFYKDTKFEIRELNDSVVQALINGHSIKDSGFGFSQILPILVQALLLKEGQLLLLEQPEIHLHPELEYKLAYFLLCICKNDRQIIAETHSEHIINQLIISKLEVPESQELFAMYFLKKDATGETKFEPIEISDRGEIIEWPEGFFDQYLKFTQNVIRKRRERVLKKKDSTTQEKIN